MRTTPAKVRLMPVELCGREPLSIRDLLDELGQNQLSGQQRRAMHREVQETIASFYEKAREMEGTDERAAMLLLRMLARDVTFKVEPWMVELFAAHREALDEAFHQPDANRATDYGSARSDGDDAAENVAKISGSPAKTRAQSVEKLHAVASLFVRGRVDEAAQLADVRPPELLRWQQWNTRFRAACRNVRNFQDERQAAE